MYNCYLEIFSLTQETLKLLDPLEVTRGVNGNLLVHFTTERIDAELLSMGLLFYIGEGHYGFSVKGDTCEWSSLEDAPNHNIKSLFYIYFGLGELESNEG